MTEEMLLLARKFLFQLARLMAEAQIWEFKSTQNAHTHTFPDCKIRSEKCRTFQTSTGKTFVP